MLSLSLAEQWSLRQFELDINMLFQLLLLISSMYGSSNIFARSRQQNSTGNSYNSNRFNSPNSSTDQSQNIGTYRVEYKDGEKPSALMTSINPNWREFPPLSIMTKEKVLHLSSIELRIQDYFLIRNRKLSQSINRHFNTALKNQCFNQELLKKECYKLFAYSNQRALDLDVLRNGANRNNSPLGSRNGVNSDSNNGNSSQNNSSGGYLGASRFNYSGNNNNTSNNVFSRNSQNDSNNNNDQYNRNNNTSQGSNIFNSNKPQNSHHQNAYNTRQSTNSNNIFSNQTNNSNSSSSNIFNSQSKNIFNQNSNSSNPLTNNNNGNNTNNGNNSNSNNGYSNNNGNNASSNQNSNNGYNNNSNNGSSNNNSNNNNSNNPSNNIFNTKNNSSAGNNQNNQNNNSNGLFNNQHNQLFQSNHNNSSNSNNYSHHPPNSMSLNNNSGMSNANLFGSNPYELLKSQAMIFNGIIKEIEQRVVERINPAQATMKFDSFNWPEKNSSFFSLNDDPYRDPYFNLSYTKRKKQPNQTIQIFISSQDSTQKEQLYSSKVLTSKNSFKNNNFLLPLESKIQNNSSSKNNNKFIQINLTKKCQSILIRDFSCDSKCFCSVRFDVRWVDGIYQNQVQIVKEDIELPFLEVNKASSLQYLVSVLKESFPVIRSDAKIILSQKSSIVNERQVMLFGTIQQKAINLSQKYYQIFYTSIKKGELHNFTIIKKENGVKTATISWQKPIRYEFLDFSGPNVFNLQLSQVICNLPELNSKCRITFSQLPPKIKKIYQQSGKQQAIASLNSFIDKKNNPQKLFTLCSIYNDGSWTLIVQKFN